MANPKKKLIIAISELPMCHPVRHLAGLRGSSTQTIYAMSNRFEAGGIGYPPGRLSPSNADWLIYQTDRIAPQNNPVRALLEPPLKRFRKRQERAAAKRKSKYKTKGEEMTWRCLKSNVNH